MSSSWEHTDEWYVFTNQPSQKGAAVMYSIDGEAIDSNGNILWMKDYDFGIGKDHPVAWYKDIGEGRSYYTSIGNTAATYQDPNYRSIIRHAIRWAGKLDQ